MALVTIGLVTWNSASDVARCLDGIRAQRHQPIELLVGDNASADGTRALLEAGTTATERRYFPTNLGFSAAHNALIRESHGTYYVTLNPDVVLDAGFTGALVDALEAAPRAGSGTGKLRRAEPPGVLDSTGIEMHRSQRHVDRGAGEPDRGQYDTSGPVFGVSGAAGCYRRAMLDDVAIAGEVFDEDFFAYREDADLAWRAQLLGWDALYVPTATAAHVRRVTPERRSALPGTINRYSVRNRFLLRLKNQTAGQAARFAVAGLARDAQVVAYVLAREWSSIPGLVDVVRLLPRTLAKRRAIMARRDRGRSIDGWFA
ncbi:MAG: glycosyltransferase family 2 protein [Vicinamibacteraceae bacterium]